jgi:hypothetical protein
LYAEKGEKIILQSLLENHNIFALPFPSDWSFFRLTIRWSSFVVTLMLMMMVIIIITTTTTTF